MEKLVDLHIHTTASDGTLSPRACVAMARELGLAAMAVTDHDTAAGLPEALAAGEELGMPVVPGVELAADWRGRSVHILGLFIDPASPGLRPALDWAVEQRERRNQKILAAMAGDGLVEAALAKILPQFRPPVSLRLFGRKDLIRLDCTTAGAA